MTTRKSRATATPAPYVPTEEHKRDIQTIFDALQQESEDRGWCDEFQDFVRDVNQSLTVPFELPPQEFNIDIRPEGGYPYDSDEQTVTIEAESKDDAVSKVAEIVNKYLRGELVEKPKD